MSRVVLIPTETDQAFRRTLVEVAPTHAVRLMLSGALAAGPEMNGRERSIAHFGDDMPTIAGRACELAEWLDTMMAARRKLPGFIDWLNNTGFGNDRRMIAALYEWSLLERQRPVGESVH